MTSFKETYDSPCPGWGKQVKGHRHTNYCKPLTVISKPKPWNPEAFAEVLAAYVWASLDPKTRSTFTDPLPDDKQQGQDLD